MTRTFIPLAALALAAALAGCAQTAAHQHDARGPGAGPGPGRAMDSQMRMMHEWHERMSRAQTAEERQALMSEHRTLMHDQMAAAGRMRMGGGMGMDDCMAPRRP